jgi:uncharacterized membrane protein
MYDNIILMTVVRFLHDLATAVWIGGLIAMGLAVLPALKKKLGVGPQTRQLSQAVQGRLRALTLSSIAVLLITGVLMSRRNPQFHGLLSWDNPYSAVLSLKHLLVIGMVLVTAIRGLSMRRALSAAAPPAAGPSKKERASAALLLANVFLGIGVILLSALSAVIAKGGPR